MSQLCIDFKQYQERVSAVVPIRFTGKVVHVDPLPVFMEHEGIVLTEWPPITAPEIQDFLRVTHLTPMAIGYRFYQEL